MHILLCHERLLFRFGADRVLLLLGKYLAERGHTVSFMAMRADASVVASFAHKVITLPTVEDYGELDTATTAWLTQHYDALFAPGQAPDIVVSGGWPFFSSLPFFRQKAGVTVFMDFGIVPRQGYHAGMQGILDRLAELKTSYLPMASCVTAISDFILTTQTLGYAQGLAPCRTILLGADHLDLPLWTTELDGAEGTGLAARIIADLRAADRPILFCMGRFETGCYKNGDAVFALSDRIARQFPQAAILVLADPAGEAIPAAYRDRLIPVGFPSDAELTALMRACDLGLSVSLWEGFNLPLAEMQWLERPALAFDLGAHPEVVCDPWYLCRDADQMGEKACQILRGEGSDAAHRRAALDKFKAFFRWERFTDENEALFDRLLRRDPTLANEVPRGFKPGLTVIMDVTNACLDTANSGVIRVTRRLGRELLAYVRVVFVVWDREAGCYVMPDAGRYERLAAYNGPERGPDLPVSPAGERLTLEAFLPQLRPDALWLLFCETVNEKTAAQARTFARQQGIRLAAIFYDAIAILRQELCNEEVVQNHANYMRGLAACDVILPISGFSGICLGDFWRDNGLAGCTIADNLLPAEFGGQERITSRDPASRGAPVELLCVSTLEPRKNHENLLAACEMLSREHPDLDWRLTLVGNRYAGDSRIAPMVEQACAQNPRIRWLGVVDDATLSDLYRRSDLTIYPSQIEGFGMPILESLWHATPCLCYQGGVMAELAAEGGCLTCDVFDPASLAQAMARLIGDPALRDRLVGEATRRVSKTWDDYARQTFYTLRREDLDRGPVRSLSPGTVCWREYLFGPAGIAGLSDAAQLGLTGLLTRLRPKVAMDIAWGPHGAAQLLAQYCEILFCLGPEIPASTRPDYPANVSRLCGDPERIVLPVLDELARLELQPQCILVEGRASNADAILRTLLRCVPPAPLFVIVTGGLTNWDNAEIYPNVHFFAPDCFRDASDQGLGGMALAYVLPYPR